MPNYFLQKIAEHENFSAIKYENANYSAELSMKIFYITFFFPCLNQLSMIVFLWFFFVFFHAKIFQITNNAKLFLAKHS